MRFKLTKNVFFHNHDKSFNTFGYPINGKIMNNYPKISEQDLMDYILVFRKLAAINVRQKFQNSLKIKDISTYVDLLIKIFIILTFNSYRLS